MKLQAFLEGVSSLARNWAPIEIYPLKNKTDMESFAEDADNLKKDFLSALNKIEVKDE